MKFQTLPLINLTRPRLISFFSMASLMLSLTFFCQIGQAQQAQLSLADILIGLRSKKVSLDERNRLLGDAVKVRGITFSLTPEIETELAGTGASVDLVNAIRQKSVNIKVSAVTKPASVAAAPTMDFAFYRKRADENTIRGDFDLAVNDYTKAIELNPKDAATYLYRGRAYTNQKSYDLAILDYDKTLELNPKDVTALFNRGEIHEKRGNAQQAMSDYQKAIEFDAKNEPAKTGLKRVQDEQAKIEQTRIEKEKIEQAKVLAKQKKTEAVALAAPTPKTPAPSDTPKTIELGSLVAQVVKMIMPLYPPVARQSKIAGQVTVQIAFDEKGSVISAKAVNGPTMLRGASEDAARRTKFKPALVASEAVKATGYIVYNFSAN